MHICIDMMQAKFNFTVYSLKELDRPTVSRKQNETLIWTPIGGNKKLPRKPKSQMREKWRASWECGKRFPARSGTGAKLGAQMKSSRYQFQQDESIWNYLESKWPTHTNSDTSGNELKFQIRLRKFNYIGKWANIIVNTKHVFGTKRVVIFLLWQWL